jgi:hypothetical protein
MIRKATTCLQGRKCHKIASQLGLDKQIKLSSQEDCTTLRAMGCVTYKWVTIYPCPGVNACNNHCYRNTTCHNTQIKTKIKSDMCASFIIFSKYTHLNCIIEYHRLTDYLEILMIDTYHNTQIKTKIKSDTCVSSIIFSKYTHLNCIIEHHWHTDYSYLEILKTDTTHYVFILFHTFFVHLFS